MKKQISENLFIQAEDLLNEAYEELQRAEEDVVTPAVCYNAKKTIVNFMEGFLIRNMQAPSGPMSMEQLRAACARIDPAFDELDFSGLNCKHSKELDPAEFCMPVEKVKSCYDVAVDIRDLIQRSDK